MARGVAQPGGRSPKGHLADGQPSRRQRLPEGHLLQQVSIQLVGGGTLRLGELHPGGGAGKWEEAGGVLSFLLLRVLQVQSAQFQLDVPTRVRFALGPVLVPAVGSCVGLQFGQQLLTAAQRQPAAVTSRI